ncbi:flagellar protein FliT [Dyella telluris]|uniref:Flagellar protein FliT n=1 Tax=Dyella telluris TaxID=2763498 RepID=A0A7G8Q725_9GAMM|nr:flagellar protein FliT [Dyella telluris]QNK02583.1 flagellar protein FliT [Dyella telluris]
MSVFYEQLLDLSERMLAAARSGDWEAVVSLEEARGKGIVALPNDDAAVLPLLRQLLAHTEEVRALAGRQRDRLGTDLEEHPHRHRALSAYLVAGAE